MQSIRVALQKLGEASEELPQGIGKRPIFCDFLVTLYLKMCDYVKVVDYK